jgi:hypothetical protein
MTAHCTIVNTAAALDAESMGQDKTHNVAGSLGSANRRVEGRWHATGVGRIASLDQLRGYVRAMFVVNFWFFAVARGPAALKHHNTYQLS